MRTLLLSYCITFCFYSFGQNEQAIFIEYDPIFVSLGPYPFWTSRDTLDASNTNQKDWKKIKKYIEKVYPVENPACKDSIYYVEPESERGYPNIRIILHIGEKVLIIDLWEENLSKGFYVNCSFITHSKNSDRLIKKLSAICPNSSRSDLNMISNPKYRSYIK